MNSRRQTLQKNLLLLLEKPWFYGCFLIGSALSVYGFGVCFPAANWDIIGYTASAYYFQGIDPEVLHQKTFSDIKATVSEEHFRLLIDDNEYRRVVASSGQSLLEHIPFYSIRILYVGLIKVGVALGISAAFLTYFWSALFGGLLTAALFFFAPKSRHVYWVMPLVIWMSGVAVTATSSTPDTMASLFAVLLIFSFIKELPVRFLLAFLLPLVRTDYIILCGLLALIDFSNKKFKSGVLIALLPAATYIFANAINQNYGYLKIFTFTLIGLSPFPATLQPPTELFPYVQAYLFGLKKFSEHGHFYLYLLMIYAWYKKKGINKEPHSRNIFFLVNGYVLFHFLLFPAYYSRFYIWTSALCTLLLIDWYLLKKTLQEITGGVAK